MMKTEHQRRELEVESMIYIGIDPGKNGGIAILEPFDVTVFSFTEEAFINAMLRIDEKEAVACVENVHAMPGQGVTSMFSFGKSCGFIEGVLRACHIPYELVTPQKWKKEFSVTGDKNSSINVCQRLFPGVNLLPTERCRKAHDGMAEALLMAEYARRKWL